METKQKIKNGNQLDLSNFNNEGSGDKRACFWMPTNAHAVRANQNHRSIAKNKIYHHQQFANHEMTDEPIDLTCSNRRNRCENYFANSTEVTDGYGTELIKLPNSLLLDSNTNNHIVKRRGRKRKYNVQEQFCVPNSNWNRLNSDGSEYFQIADNKKAEVLKAAKSLFSKRTRTLYHWMYPDTPKTQLKAAVATSWDTLGTQEKEFYISQVLGRFGFPQANLMINPQLGSLPGIMALPPLAPPSEESSSAVSDLLLSEGSNSNHETWGHLAANIGGSSYMTNKKRNRLGRPPGSKNRKSGQEEYITELKSETIVECPAEEFQDDPELCHEFQQFKWALNLNTDAKS